MKFISECKWPISSQRYDILKILSVNISLVTIFILNKKDQDDVILYYYDTDSTDGKWFVTSLSNFEARANAAAMYSINTGQFNTMKYSKYFINLLERDPLLLSRTWWKENGVDNFQFDADVTITDLTGCYTQEIQAFKILWLLLNSIVHKYFFFSK